MDESVLKDYGWCEVLRRGGKYVLRYDGGGVAVKMMEYEVTENEAHLAQEDQEQAEKIIIQIQKRMNQS